MRALFGIFFSGIFGPIISVLLNYHGGGGVSNNINIPLTLKGDVQ